MLDEHIDCFREVAVRTFVGQFIKTNTPFLGEVNALAKLLSASRTDVQKCLDDKCGAFISLLAYEQKCAKEIGDQLP